MPSIDLSKATFHSDLVISGLETNDTLDLSEAFISGNLRLIGKFQDDQVITASNSEIGKDLVLEKLTCNKAVVIEETTVKGTTRVEQVKIKGGFQLKNYSIINACIIEDSTIDGGLNFEFSSIHSIRLSKIKANFLYFLLVNDIETIRANELEIIDNFTIDHCHRLNAINLNRLACNQLRILESRINNLKLRHFDAKQVIQIQGGKGADRKAAIGELTVVESNIEAIRLEEAQLGIESSKHSRVKFQHVTFQDFLAGFGDNSMIHSEVSFEFCEFRQLDLKDLPVITNDDKHLSLRDCAIKYFKFDFDDRCRPKGIVDLTRTKVDKFEDYETAWPKREESQYKLILDGFEYMTIMNPSGAADKQDENTIYENRKAWLMSQVEDDIRTNFKPQPWKQLTKVLARQGYENAPIKLSIERRVVMREFEDTVGKFTSNFLHKVSDYGFNPWLAVGWSFLLVLIFALFYGLIAMNFCTSEVGLCANSTAFIRTDVANFAPALNAGHNINEIYPSFHPLFYSLDAFVPFIDFGSQHYWRANDQFEVGLYQTNFFLLKEMTFGHVLHAITIIEKILGGIFISLIITGFTGMLTKDEMN